MSSAGTRPSLQRKTTPKDRQRKHDETAGQQVGFRLNDMVIVVREGDIDAATAMACRRETGRSFRAWMDAAQTDPDIDALAVIAWAARRAEGERDLRLDDVLAEVTYAADIEALDDGEAAEPPEA